MKGKIFEIKSMDDELILPVTTVEAIYMEDGIAKLSDKLSDTDYQFNVKHYGVKVGNDVDVVKNTEIIQDLINKHDDLVLYFPSGIYRLNSLDLGINKNITFVGKSSAFATSVNKDIANPRIIDTYSKIVVDLPKNEYFLNHTNCTVIVDKISFINGNVSDSNDITVSKNNYFIKTITNSNKGKVFCTDSSFIGWKQVGGDSECLTKENELLHCCFMANRTRFTENIIAIGNPLDSRFVDCTFNKNQYAIVSNKNSGFTTVNGCRIEWNRINGIKLINSKEFIITSCEFDRQGYSALSIEKSVRCTISNNVFRRNGANEELTIEDNINNCHMYLSENEEMIVTGNITLAKSILDTSGAKERPTFSATVVNNNWITLKDNSLRGCTKSNKDEAFIRIGNTNSYIENNMTYNANECKVIDTTDNNGNAYNVIVRKDNKTIMIKAKMTYNSGEYSIKIPAIEKHLRPIETMYAQRVKYSGDVLKIISLHVNIDGTIEISGNIKENTSVNMCYVIE